MPGSGLQAEVAAAALLPKEEQIATMQQTVDAQVRMFFRLNDGLIIVINGAMLS